jgi:hypothetical protein
MLRLALQDLLCQEVQDVPVASGEGLNEVDAVFAAPSNATTTLPGGKAGTAQRAVPATADAAAKTNRPRK